jgi:hypothetical protein
MVKRIIGISLLALLTVPAQAQRRKARQQARPQRPAPKAQRADTVIKGTTLEVYQVYQPEMKPVQKPAYTPAVPPADKEPVAQRYEVPQQTLLYSYRALPLRPLALGKDSGTLPPQSYALLGGGNLSTILAEAGLGNLRGDGWKADVFGRYLRQEGALDNQVYRNFSLKGNAELNTGTQLLDADAEVSRKVFGRYGYDHDLLRYDPDAVRMKYDEAGIRLGLRNTEPGPASISYHPVLGLRAWDGPQGHETDVDVLLPATKQLDSNLSLGLALNAQLAFQNWNAPTQHSLHSNLLQLTPSLDFRRDGFSAHAGISPTLSEGDGLLWLPDVSLHYRFWQERLSVAAGWKAERIQNTLRQLTIDNPYFYPGAPDAMQTTRHEVSGEIDLALGSHVSVWGRAAWQSNDVLPLFITRPFSDGKDFSIVNERDVKAVSWGGGVRYQVGEYFSVGAQGQWYNYYHQDSLRHVYGKPAVQLRGDLSWRAAKGLLLTSYMEVMDEIWGLNASGTDVRQKGVFDFGLAGEYNVVSRLSVFLRADNLLGRRNERWLGYPSFGFNLYGGLRLRF